MFKQYYLENLDSNNLMINNNRVSSPPVDEPIMLKYDIGLKQMSVRSENIVSRQFLHERCRSDSPN